MYSYFLIAFRTVAIVAGSVVFAWWLHRRLRAPWSVWWWGALAWVAAQVIHLPLLAVLTPFIQRNAASRSALLFAVNVLILGGTAGLFEETARYIILRYGARNARSWVDGVMFGAGHGGAEAILIMVYAAVVSVVLLASGDVLLERTRAVSPGQAAALATQLSALRNLSLGPILLAIWERAIAITVHVAFTLVVLKGVRAHRLVWLLVAIVAHALMDGTVVVVGRYTQNPVLIEAVLTALAAIGAYFIVREYRAAKSRSATSPSSAPLPTP
jgi:uncharacterized membrane protein YhfC